MLVSPDPFPRVSDLERVGNSRLVTDVNGESAALVSLVAWGCHDGSAAFGTVIIEKGEH